MNKNEQYISRCIQLAKNGLGTTYPNPLVGSVVVYQDKIIGEGWHHQSGENHAEVNAIQSVKDKSLLKKSTLYVSLEPCSHFGKTPPCSDLIISMNIKKVVVGMVDPFEKVAGKGIKKLIDAGCEVVVGVLEEKCQQLNKRFLCFYQKKRPYIILKWAESIDGFLSPFVFPEKNKNNAPVWITNSHSKQLVHRWRSQENSILIGSNTAIADNAKLNTRLWKGASPTRIIIDQKLSVPTTHFVHDQSVKTIFITDKKTHSDRIIENDHLKIERINFNDNLPKQICNILYNNSIQSVIIEGGRQTLQAFIDYNTWDEARIFTGDKIFKQGTKAPKINKNIHHQNKILTDQLKLIYND
ncbi:MAG: bifunctional diaminohydroxyphosphoribosylaminopyrimidine deaminase/5-amino-6-(5-phosphoribosylamino)uracil reductase RibD [Bacteroidota bacterium]